MAIARHRFVTESPGLRHAPSRQGSFAGHTCTKHSQQRYVTTGRDKGYVTGACRGAGGGGPATKMGLDSQPYNPY